MMNDDDGCGWIRGKGWKVKSKRERESESRRDRRSAGKMYAVPLCIVPFARNSVGHFSVGWPLPAASWKRQQDGGGPFQFALVRFGFSPARL